MIITYNLSINTILKYMQLEYIGRYLINKTVLNIGTDNNRYDITDKKFLCIPFLRCVYIIRNS